MPDSKNEQHEFAPHDVAGMFGVSVMTVRRWADYHKEHLSTSANPSPGKPRAFTWSDVERFRQIKAWRDEGLSVEAINNRLSGRVTNPITATVIPDRLEVSVDAPDAIESTRAPIVGQDYLMSIERRFEALQASIDEVKRAPLPSQWDGVTMFGVGFIAALLFVLLLLALFLLRHSL
jgi:DNA-binding transcriptional MerR regulator